jgi:hypothetical protein
MCDAAVACSVLCVCVWLLEVSNHDNAFLRSLFTGCITSRTFLHVTGFFILVGCAPQTAAEGVLIAI